MMDFDARDRFTDRAERDERWKEASDDRNDVRDDIRSAFEQVDQRDHGGTPPDQRRAPKPEEDGSLRGDIAREFDTWDFSQQHAAADQRRMNEVRSMMGEIERTHRTAGGEPLDGLDGLKRLMRAEEHLRRDPDNALAYMAAQYSPQARQALEMQRQASLRAEAENYFQRAGMSPAVEHRTVELLQSGAIKNADPIERLRAAHAQALKEIRR